MNKLGKDFSALLAGDPIPESTTVRGSVTGGGAGGVTVLIGGGEVVVAKAIGPGFAADIAAGRVTAGVTVELSRVGGVYAVRGLVQGF